jgi:hypothetical protein
MIDIYGEEKLFIIMGISKNQGISLGFLFKMIKMIIIMLRICSIVISEKQKTYYSCLNLFFLKTIH